MRASAPCSAADHKPSDCKPPSARTTAVMEMACGRRQATARGTPPAFGCGSSCGRVFTWRASCKRS